MFQTALDAYLKRDDVTETALASAIGKSQASIHRYRKGARFPDAETARLIDAHTSGAVSFAVWQRDFMQKSGIAA